MAGLKPGQLSSAETRSSRRTRNRLEGSGTPKDDRRAAELKPVGIVNKKGTVDAVPF